jgi:hypothetical protein
VPRFRKCGSIHPLTHTPSCRNTLLLKQSGNFTLRHGRVLSKVVVVFFSLSTHMHARFLSYSLNSSLTDPIIRRYIFQKQRPDRRLFSRGQSGLGVKLIVHFYLVPSFRIPGAIPPLPIHFHGSTLNYKNMFTFVTPLDPLLSPFVRRHLMGPKRSTDVTVLGN